MKCYEMELVVKVMILAGGTDRGYFKVKINANDSYNAVLQATQIFTLEDFKFMQETKKKEYQYTRSWEKAFNYKIEEVRNVKLIK